MARIPGHPQVRAGDDVWLGWQAADQHFFSAADGQRIVAPTPAVTLHYPSNKESVA